MENTVKINLKNKNKQKLLEEKKEKGRLLGG